MCVYTHILHTQTHSESTLVMIMPLTHTPAAALGQAAGSAHPTTGSFQGWLWGWVHTSCWQLPVPGRAKVNPSTRATSSCSKTDRFAGSQRPCPGMALTCCRCPRASAQTGGSSLNLLHSKSMRVCPRHYKAQMAFTAQRYSRSTEVQRGKNHSKECKPSAPKPEKAAASHILV